MHFQGLKSAHAVLVRLCPKRRKGAFAGRPAVLEMMEPRLFLNGHQIVTSVPETIVTRPNTNVAIDVIYSTSDGNELLSGLGLRMHYDSSRLVYNGLSDVRLFRFSQSHQDQADLNDFDADPTTDRFVVII